MKNGRRPTRRQKIAIQSANLEPGQWLVYKSEPDRLHIVRKGTDETQIIPW